VGISGTDSGDDGAEAKGGSRESRETVEAGVQVRAFLIRLLMARVEVFVRVSAALRTLEMIAGLYVDR